MRDRWQVAITFRAKVLGTVLAVLGCLAALLCSSIARAGSVSLPGYHIIFIDGDIDASTLTEFRVLVAQIDGWGMVRLNSPGGDLESAISIGRIVRAQSLGTEVAHQDSCASACIFILAAGVDRSAYGKIGIHRPHFSSTYFAGLSPEDARQKYEQLEALARSYLHEMGIPDGLFTSMMSVPSDEIQWLSDKSIYNFGLDGLDPAYDEWLRAQYTQKFGPDGYRRHHEALLRIGQCFSRHDGACTRKVIASYPELWDPRLR